jgi:hypothetical protein
LLHFVFRSQTTKACIVRCARNEITTLKIVITLINLAVADVGSLDMALASVGKLDDEVEKKRQESTGKHMQWLDGTTNLKRTRTSIEWTDRLISPQNTIAEEEADEEGEKHSYPQLSLILCI